MKRDVITSLSACLGTLVLCSVVYPFVVWAVAQIAFPWQAQGSLIVRDDGTIVGSSLIAQSFKGPGYFHPRPSAVDYKADASGGSNLAPTNPQLTELMSTQAAAEGATQSLHLPVDLATRSGSGLDPHLSVEAAKFQVERIATARGIDALALAQWIDRRADHSWWFLGAPPRVNVLELNLALDGKTTSRE